jgi:hypothetical protein
MIKIGFLINYNHFKWLGGIYVIKHLIYGINKHLKKEIQPILIVNNDLSKKAINDLKQFDLIKTNLFHNQPLLNRLRNKLSVIFFGRSSNYENFFLKEKINLVSHINVFGNNVIFGKKSVAKSLSFIADFQHLHFKENFSVQKRIMRNLNTFLCAYFSSKILLISNNAKKDLKRISNVAYNNSVISKFIFQIPAKKEIINLSIIKKKYKFNMYFFYVPNQYWVHKNHFVILKAIKYIKEKNNLKKILILSSGLSNDYRNPNHFLKIKNFISENNLENNYKYLGVIPFKDVLSLIYHSKAVINPSKFEGRSSTVEQANSMSKKIILSNINIHKEQKPENAEYFDPNNYKQLSKILLNNCKYKNKSKNYYKNAQQKNNDNMKIYCNNYLRIVKNLIKKKN